MMIFRRFSTFGPLRTKQRGLYDLLNESVNATSRSRIAGNNLLNNNNNFERIVLPPRTGPLVGRSVAVNSPESLPMAIRQLNSLNSLNKVNKVKRLQRFAERPGKARLRIRIERKRREFQQGIRKLWELTNEARRKGY